MLMHLHQLKGKVVLVLFALKQVLLQGMPFEHDAYAKAAINWLFIVHAILDWSFHNGVIPMNQRL